MRTTLVASNVTDSIDKSRDKAVSKSIADDPALEFEEPGSE